MVCDSHRTKPPSSIVGTSEFGFIFRYSGVLVTPNCMPASTRSYFSPSSSAAHSAFFTLTEFIRPQIFSISPLVLEIDILECEHGSQLFLGTLGKAAPINKVGRVLVCGEQSIPQRNVAEVVLVDVVLMMHRMKLRCLNEVAKPPWSADVRVIEVFTDAGEEVVPE